MSTPAAAVVVLTAEQLESLVDRAVRRALADAAGPERPLTSEQAAEALGITPKTLRSWAAGGRVHGTKQGRSWRFTRAQVDAARHPAAAEADAVMRRLG